jgi:hypothetical protein
MHILESILSSQNSGSFAVLTGEDVRMFPARDQCEAFTATVNGSFAVLQLLSSGHHVITASFNEGGDRDPTLWRPGTDRIQQVTIWKAISRSISIPMARTAPIAVKNQMVSYC